MIFGLDRAGKFILDIIFPVQCLGCEKEGEWLCGECQNKIIPNHNSLRGEFLNRVFTFYSYENEILKKSIHGLKYKFVEDLAAPLGTLLARELKKVQDQIGAPDFLLPTPLHEKRLLERGFNQSLLLALIIREHFGWPIENAAVVRSRPTSPQVDLDEVGRKKNISGAFTVIDLPKVLNKKIVLIDDVSTSGATMEECARVLREAGAREVLGVALAKG